MTVTDVTMQPADEATSGLFKALVHPLRVEVLRYLLTNEEGSPLDIAKALDVKLPNVSYHVRSLLDAGVVELTRQEQRRGALQHYYKLTDPDRAGELLAAYAHFLGGKK